MRRWFGLVLAVGTLAVALFVFVPRSTAPSASASKAGTAAPLTSSPATPAPTGTASSVSPAGLASPADPVSGYCPPGFVRCLPTPSPLSSGSLPWEGVVVVLGLACMIGLVGSRRRHRRVVPHLPLGVRATLLRPPQPSLLAL